MIDLKGSDSMSAVLDILPSEVKRRLDAGEEMQIIDVRELDEVQQGMIPGARHIALGELPSRFGEIDGQREVIFVCRSGGRSGRACELASSQGLGKIHNMVGGMLAWDGDLA